MLRVDFQGFDRSKLQSKLQDKLQELGFNPCKVAVNTAVNAFTPKELMAAQDASPVLVIRNSDFKEEADARKSTATNIQGEAARRGISLAIIDLHLPESPQSVDDIFNSRPTLSSIQKLGIPRKPGVFKDNTTLAELITHLGKVFGLKPKPVAEKPQPTNPPAKKKAASNPATAKPTQTSDDRPNSIEDLVKQFARTKDPHTLFQGSKMKPFMRKIDPENPWYPARTSSNNPVSKAVSEILQSGSTGLLKLQKISEYLSQKVQTITTFTPGNAVSFLRSFAALVDPRSTNYKAQLLEFRKIYNLFDTNVFKSAKS